MKVKNTILSGMLLSSFIVPIIVPSTASATGYVSGFYRNYINTFKPDYSVRFNYKYPVLSQTYQNYRRRGQEKNNLNLSCGPTALLLAKNHKDRSFTYISNKNSSVYKRSIDDAYSRIPLWLRNIMNRPTTTNHNTNSRELEYIAKSYGKFRSINTYTDDNVVDLFKKLDNVVSMGYMTIIYLDASASRAVNQTGYTHAVIVYALNNRYVYYVDPWDGRRKRVSRRSFQNAIHTRADPDMLYLK